MSDSEIIYLQGSLDIPLDEIELVKRALPEHIRLTKLEAGCLSFEVKFSDTDASKLLVDETFINLEAFEAHQKRMRASEWFKITEKFSRNYTLLREKPKTA